MGETVRTGGRRSIKITDLKVLLTMPEVTGRTFIFLHVETDEGITGIGKATGSGGGVVIGNMLRSRRCSGRLGSNAPAGRHECGAP
jgi:L-alanine-DL-glutamate epimerase-like enolase superfamily enzyme